MNGKKLVILEFQIGVAKALKLDLHCQMIGVARALASWARNHAGGKKARRMVHLEEGEAVNADEGAVNNEPAIVHSLDFPCC